MLLMVVVVNGTVVRLKVCLREKELEEEERNGRWVRIEKRGVSLAIETVPRSSIVIHELIKFWLKRENKERQREENNLGLV